MVLLRNSGNFQRKQVMDHALEGLLEFILLLFPGHSCSNTHSTTMFCSHCRPRTTGPSEHVLKLWHCEPNFSPPLCCLPGALCSSDRKLTDMSSLPSLSQASLGSSGLWGWVSCPVLVSEAARLLPYGCWWTPRDLPTSRRVSGDPFSFGEKDEETEEIAMKSIMLHKLKIYGNDITWRVLDKHKCRQLWDKCPTSCLEEERMNGSDCNGSVGADLGN